MNKYILSISVIVVAISLTACGGGSGGGGVDDVGDGSASGTTCLNNNVSSVDTGNGCLQLLTSRSIEKPRILWVFLHGDGSDGGASDYIFNKLKGLAGGDSVAVGMIRPGYFTSDGRVSTGPDSDRRFGNYTQAVTDTLAAGLSKLKAHYEPDELIVVGHSGGAALAALISSFHPNVADRTVLAACPCNLPQWTNTNENTLFTSLSPHRYVNQLSTEVPVLVVVGENDTNTFPQISIDYTVLAQTAGVMATYEVIAGSNHNGIIGSQLIALILQWTNN